MCLKKIMEKSTLLKNGIVYDPLNGICNKKMDVLLHEGRVALVGEQLDSDQLKTVAPSWTEYDVDGCLLCPGLIDLHVHCFPTCTSLGIDPDETCLPRGVTTVVDAGSAGSNDFDKFQMYTKTRKTRILCFLHVSRLGLTRAGCATDESSIGELECLDDVDIAQCVECVQANPATIVGTKLRLSAMLANDGRNELESLRRALQIRQETKLPLMVHHSFSTIPLTPSDCVELGVPGSLFEGDIRTHMFHGFETNIVDLSHGVPGCVDSSLYEAKGRGVYSDLGHGQGGFSWTVAEIAAKEHLWPDAISTDLHIGNVQGPAYDLPTVMTKLLHVGMPVRAIIEAVTSKPASIIGQQKNIGSLSHGACADVTILHFEDCDMMLEDCQGQMRQVRQRFSPVAVWRGGERMQIVDKMCPNKKPQYLVDVEKERNLLLVHDRD